MVTTDQANANLSAAQKVKADLETKGKALNPATQFAEIMKLGGEYQKAEAAIGKAEREIKSAQVESSKGERDTLSELVAKGLVARKADIAREIAKSHLLLIATRSSDESGFDDYQIKVGLNDKGDALSNILHEVLEVAKANEITSAKRIRVDVDEVSVDPVVTTRAPKAAGGGSSTNGTSGKGFDKDGVHLQLQAAFNQSATAEEMAHLGTLSGSNPTYSYKKKVVLAAGFTQS